MISSRAGGPLTTLSSFGCRALLTPRGPRSLIYVASFASRLNSRTASIVAVGPEGAALHVGFQLPLMCTVSLHPSILPAPKAICPF